MWWVCQRNNFEAQAGWADLSLEQLLEELAEIKQIVLLYPPQGEKGHRFQPMGFNAFAGSPMLQELNAGNYNAVPVEMMKWTEVGESPQ